MTVHLYSGSKCNIFSYFSIFSNFSPTLWCVCLWGWARVWFGGNPSPDLTKSSLQKFNICWLSIKVVGSGDRIGWSSNVGLIGLTNQVNKNLPNKLNQNWQKLITKLNRKIHNPTKPTYNNPPTYTIHSQQNPCNPTTHQTQSFKIHQWSINHKDIILL